jgi:hypothetical protein
VAKNARFLIPAPGEAEAAPPAVSGAASGCPFFDTAACGPELTVRPVEPQRRRVACGRLSLTTDCLPKRLGLERIMKTCEGVGLRTAGLGALDVEQGIAARDDRNPRASTEFVREKDQVAAEARRRGNE